MLVACSKPTSRAMSFPTRPPRGLLLCPRPSVLTGLSRGSWKFSAFVFPSLPPSSANGVPKAERATRSCGLLKAGDLGRGGSPKNETGLDWETSFETKYRRPDDGIVSWGRPNDRNQFIERWSSCCWGVRSKSSHPKARNVIDMLRTREVTQYTHQAFRMWASMFVR